jgi:hypothetical protein
MTKKNYLPFVINMIRDGYFKVDGQGRIWRIAAKWWDSTSKTNIKIVIPRRRAEVKKKGGHLQVVIKVDGKNRGVAAHRVVWTIFNGNIPVGKIINHKNGVKDDNRPRNLEAITLKENSIHARDVLGRWRGPKTATRGEGNVNSILKEKDIIAIRAMLDNGNRHVDIAEKFNVCTTTIHNIKHGKTWAHVP